MGSLRQEATVGSVVAPKVLECARYVVYQLVWNTTYACV
jgi:hypothetical protein